MPPSPTVHSDLRMILLMLCCCHRSVGNASFIVHGSICAPSLVHQQLCTITPAPATVHLHFFTSTQAPSLMHKPLHQQLRTITSAPAPPHHHFCTSTLAPAPLHQHPCTSKETLVDSANLSYMQHICRKYFSSTFICQPCVCLTKYLQILSQPAAAGQRRLGWR